MTNPVRELEKVDARIVGEIERSRQALTPLLEQRAEIVREACTAQAELGGVRPESQGDVILEFATRQAPQVFTPSEVFLYMRERVGDEVTLNLATAWLSKLVRAGKLQRKKRGVYALA